MSRYPAATFGLGTAYYLGDDIKQDFDVAHRFLISVFTARALGCTALSLLYEMKIMRV